MVSDAKACVSTAGEAGPLLHSRNFHNDDLVVNGGGGGGGSAMFLWFALPRSHHAYAIIGARPGDDRQVCVRPTG